MATERITKRSTGRQNPPPVCSQPLCEIIKDEKRMIEENGEKKEGNLRDVVIYLSIGGTRKINNSVP